MTMSGDVLLTLLLLTTSILAVYSQNCTVEGEIRLSNGTSQFEGRLDVCLDGVWGTVCDGGWRYRNNVRIVCQQLGRQLGVSIVNYVTRESNYFDQREESYSVPVHLNNVQCTGLESNLLDCRSFMRYCGHYEDVGVTCIPANSSLLPECTDELFRCSSYCEQRTFRCDNGVCVSQNTVCDDNNDCGDASDENTPDCVESRNYNRQVFENQHKTALGLSVGIPIGLVLLVALVSLSIFGLCVLVPSCPLRKLYSHKLVVVPEADVVRTDEERGRTGEGGQTQRGQELEREW